MTGMTAISLRALNTPYVPPSAYEIWNSADKNASLTLSGDDRIVTLPSATGAWCALRGLSPKNSGKWYVEAVQSGSGSNGPILGLCTSSMTLNSTAIGLVANSVGVQAFSSAGATRLFANGSVASSTTSGAVGHEAAIAVDFDAGKAWLRGDASLSWIGGGDPAAGTSPSYTFTAGATLYVGASIFDGGMAFTLPSVVGDVVGTVPTGFSIWTQ